MALQGRALGTGSMLIRQPGAQRGKVHLVQLGFTHPIQVGEQGVQVSKIGTHGMRRTPPLAQQALLERGQHLHGGRVAHLRGRHGSSVDPTPDERKQARLIAL